MAAYRLLEGGGVLRVADNSSIPENPDNTDWRVYLEWGADGGVPDPIVEPVADPMEAERAQARVEARSLVAEVVGLTDEQVTLLFNGEH